MMLFTDDAWITPKLLASRVWEPEVTEFIKQNLRPGQVFIDVGAHVGYYSLLASRLVGENGKVFAFEPDPENFEVLQMNLTLNHAKNVMPFRQALWKRSSKAKLHSYGEHYKMFPTLTPENISHPKAQLDGTTVEVETVALDNAVPTGKYGITRIDMIKVDVEGAEVPVLQGMEETLKANGSVVILEDHKGEGLKWLKDRGYGEPGGIGVHTYALTRKEAKPASAPSGSLYTRKFRFHILGVPHTKTTIEYLPCAFTQKVYRFCEMMTDAGHEVIHYGAEGSNPVCAEHVDVLSDEIQQKVYGHINWREGFFSPSKDDLAYKTFNANAIREVIRRKRSGDFLIVSMGHWHRPVTDNVKDIIPVELGIGYSGCYLKHKVFESYAWMHHIYGQLSPRKQANGQWYDAVIPNYYNPEDFIFSDKKEDYFLLIARLIPRKGANIAQQVVDELVRQGHKTRLLVGGQGNIAEVLDPGPNIEYIGVLDVHQRAEYMSKAKGLFAPTVYLEPFGSVVVEAYWSGTPVITTDFGAFPETVIHGYTGYRCRTFDQFLWAAKNIDRISPHTCRKWAEDNFSMPRIAKMYEEYFNSLSDGHKEKGWYVQHPERTELDWLGKVWPNNNSPAGGIRLGKQGGELSCTQER